MCFKLLLFLLFLGGCSEIVQHETLHPKKQKVDLEKIIDPIVPKERSIPKHLIKEPITKELLKPVSVSLSEQTPLKEILIALAKQANVDLQLDPKIDTKVVYAAKTSHSLKLLKTSAKWGN